MVHYIGDLNSKRYIYFKKAADELKIKLQPIQNEDYENKIIKIDPFNYNTYKISELDTMISNYKCKLAFLAVQQSKYLNDPLDIITFLDKIKTKQILDIHNIPNTKMLYFNLCSFDDLINLMFKDHVYNVYIKPNLGSGASFVCAFRFNKRLNKYFLYTSCKIINNTLVNTKTLFKYDNLDYIKQVINFIFKYDSLVETWIPKDKFNDYSYDLRVVYQFGKIEYIMPRLSKGPITNLHLNNKSVLVDELSLSSKLIDNINKICYDVSRIFKNSNMFALDILISTNKSPYVIEINGQGDLIYQDIYGENKIYKNQLRQTEFNN